MKSRYVGQGVKRVEDLHLLLGKDTFVDNLKMQNMVFAGFIRSPYAHARIKGIDCSALDGDPNVLGYVLPEEVQQKTEQMPVFWKPFGINSPVHYALAKDRVRYIGEPVVAVVVKDRATLEDTLEKVKVEYEVLPPVVDTLRALKKTPDTILLHDELGTNVCYEMTFGADVSEQISSSPVVIEHTFRIQRLAASPLEARGVLANYESGQLIVYISTQWPHLIRTHLARSIRIPENKIRVIAPDVGGGFGVKDEFYPEELLTAFLAVKFQRPIKWVETRIESFVGIAQARDEIVSAKLALTGDGKIIALKADITCDFGAYLQAVGAGTPFITALSLDGPYDIRAMSVDFRGVYTNKVPLSAYRGFGESEAGFVIERLMDLAARKLEIDPAEIRMRNFIQPGDFPHHTVTGGIYDSGDYPKCLADALKLSGYNERKRNDGSSRNATKVRGIGIAVYTETTGFAPSPVFGEMGLQMGGYDSAAVKVDPSGKVTIATGAFPHGQGFNTTLSQIVADELGVDISDVTAQHGDTATSPYGHGSFGSRTMTVCGTAAVFACRELKQKLSKIASSKLEIADSAKFEFSRGQIIDSSSGKSIALSEVAREAYTGHHLPQGVPPGLDVTYYYDPIGFETSYASHVCEVEVDRETGSTRVTGYWIVQDCGRMINPVIVEGQIQGAVCQAIGQALLEEVLYTSEGQLTSSSFVDYLLPSAEMVPDLVVKSSETLSPLTPLGVKGVGESGTIIGPPAIVNAICDALGVELFETPAKPERVLEALESASHGNR